MPTTTTPSPQLDLFVHDMPTYRTALARYDRLRPILQGQATLTQHSQATGIPYHQLWRDLQRFQRRIGILNAILLPPCGQRRAAAAARRCVSRVSTTSPGQHFCLYSEQMFSILGDNFWHSHPFPPGCGGCYGASGCHLRTPGSQSHGALYSDRGAPGDLSRLAR
jgi:hypothetical protein